VQGVRVLRDRLPERVVQDRGEGGRGAEAGREARGRGEGRREAGEPAAGPGGEAGEFGEGEERRKVGESPKSGSGRTDEYDDLPDLRRGHARGLDRVPGLPVLLEALPAGRPRPVARGRVPGERRRRPGPVRARSARRRPLRRPVLRPIPYAPPAAEAG